MDYINIDIDNIEQEHLCCAISGKMHQAGVDLKKKWIKEQFKNGHVFRKLNQNGKVFIEYGNLEQEYVPIIGDNYLYIYCFWVAGSFKGKGHGKNLVEYCIEEAKRLDKNGICIVGNTKKLPFLSDIKFLKTFGFELVDKAEPHFELYALKLKDCEPPKFTDKARKNEIDEDGLVIYYNAECPYILNCLEEIKEVCQEYQIDLKTHYIDTLKKAKDMPCFINNFVVFYNKKFITHELLNKNRLIHFLGL